MDAGNVFPHNLRHLFAQMYYTLEKHLSRLADMQFDPAYLTRLK